MAESVSNQLLVDLEKCIGCWACSHVCPIHLIAWSDKDGKRTLRFARTCGEDCTLCRDACPEEAIALVPLQDDVAEGELAVVFDLVGCPRCGLPFTTDRVVEKLAAVIPPAFQLDAAEERWLELCPACRQQVEGERAAREWLMVRWPAKE